MFKFYFDFKIKNLKNYLLILSFFKDSILDFVLGCVENNFIIEDPLNGLMIYND